MVAPRLRSPLALPKASMVVEHTAVGVASRREGIAPSLSTLQDARTFPPNATIYTRNLSQMQRLIVLHRPCAVGIITTHGFIAIHPLKILRSCTLAYQNINATLSEKDIQKIKAAVKAIQKSYPFSLP